MASFTRLISAFAVLLMLVFVAPHSALGAPSDISVLRGLTDQDLKNRINELERQVQKEKVEKDLAVA